MTKFRNSPLHAAALEVAHRIYCRYMPEMDADEKLKTKEEQVNKLIDTEIKATAAFAARLMRQLGYAIRSNANGESSDQ